tara:strand:- start:350 stop:1366 length:1017 start_codon:yes stop_codon:yes gene_type:complete
MKDSELVDEGSYGCVYYPSLACKGKSHPKIISKIQTDDENSKRELFLGGLIKKIPDYLSYFAPVRKKCDLNISKASFKNKKDCTLFKTYKDHTFVNQIMPYVSGKSIRDFVIRKKHPKLVIRVLLDGFHHLLKGLDILHNNDICHFDIKLDNILVDEVRNLPIWIDFGLSIYIPDFKKNIENYFYIFKPDHNTWALEVHFANLILHEKEKPTLDDIKDMCAKFADTFKDIMSQKEIQKYKDDSIQYLSSFLERKNPIDEIIKHWRKWDIYAICMEYISIFHHLRVNNRLSNELVRLFKQNIHPNPNKIKNIKEILTSFKNILEKYGTVENYQSFVDSS